MAGIGIQRRRGTTAQHASFTGLEGEITIDTTKKTLVVHDGVTAGGFPLARADQLPLVDVRTFGAKLDGTTDDTAAWNAALASGKPIYFPSGSSRITDKLSFSGVEGQSIVGENRTKSRFIVPTAFNTGASAVIQMNAAYQVIKEIGIYCTQPNTSVRANLIQYPPVININGHTRAEISAIRVESAYRGILAQGNCGGAVLDDIQMGALFQGLVVDGALDSIRLDRYHFWPFGFAGIPNLMSVLGDGITVCADFGRADDLNIGSILCFMGRLRFGNNGLGNTFGVASRITLDSRYARIEFAEGEMAIGQLYGSCELSNDYKITQSGGELKIGELALEAGMALTVPLVSVNGLYARFIASNIMITQSGGLAAFRLQEGVMHLSNGYVSDPSAITKTEAVISILGGKATVTGMRINDNLNANNTFIRVVNDGYHVIANNAFMGWKYELPAQQTAGQYGPNNGVPGNQVGTEYIPQFKVKRLTGTLNSSGALNIAHGITNGNSRAVAFYASYLDAGNARIDISGLTLDGTNVNIAAGAGGASRPVTAVVFYD